METLYIILYLFIAICTLYIVYQLVIIGKPQELKLDISGFLDSYEIWDEQKGARVKAPYLHWNSPSNALTVEVSLKYQVEKFRWGTNSAIPIKVKLLSNVQLPADLEVQLKREGDSSIYVPGYEMTIHCKPQNKCSFLVEIYHTANDLHFSKIEASQFTLEVSYRATRFLFFSSKKKVTKAYNFFVGPDLGEVWVAFDPGTSGSCVATGSETTNITMEQDIEGDRIMPSYLAFDLNQPVQNLQDIESIEKAYVYGQEALGLVNALGSGATDRAFFNSVKKLLGFKDKKPVLFSNGHKEFLSGSYLTYLLIRGMYVDLQKFITSKKQMNPDLLSLSNGAFTPQRAIVAVPNNATTFKIRDMVAAIKRMNQFREIRYISEAEAVICYYIYKYSERKNLAANEPAKETVLIFDMGGSTINTAVADITQQLEKGDYIYDIEIESKVGYGIGGDTIDYCLIKYFFQPEFIKYYKIPPSKNPFSDALDAKASRDLRKTIQLAIFDIKVQMIDFYKNRKQILLNDLKGNQDVLLYPADIKTFYTRMGIETEVRFTEPIFQPFIMNEVGEFSIFKNPLFQEYIYQPIAEAIKDTLDLSGKSTETQYTLLLSGRSMLFPLIKETIRKNLSRKIKKEVQLDNSALKTAVVKGACWYAVNREAVRLSSLRVQSNIGFKRTLSAASGHVEFHNLISASIPFEEDEDGLFCNKSVAIQNRFIYDNMRIHFYQIMSNNPEEVIIKDQKHKYAKIHSVRLQVETKEVSITLRGDDVIEYDVKLINGSTISKEKEMEEMELVDANEEHYTWLVE